jgi:hypothetical protein
MLYAFIFSPEHATWIRACISLTPTTLIVIPCGEYLNRYMENNSGLVQYIYYAMMFAYINLYLK